MTMMAISICTSPMILVETICIEMIQDNLSMSLSPPVSRIFRRVCRCVGLTTTTMVWLTCTSAICFPRLAIELPSKIGFTRRLARKRVRRFNGTREVTRCSKTRATGRFAM